MTRRKSRWVFGAALVLALAVVLVFGLTLLRGRDAYVAIPEGGTSQARELSGSLSGNKGEIYKSEAGWSMQRPVGWQVVKNERGEGFVGQVNSANDWVNLEVRESKRPTSVDDGTWPVSFKRNYEDGKLGFENGVLFGEPKETNVGMVKRFDFVIDYDALVGESKARWRFWRVEFYPIERGDGFGVSVRMPVEVWEKYEVIARRVIESFKFEK